jgi:hypothetical protein
MIKHHLFIYIFLILIACEPKVEESGVPNVAVNLEINLNDIDNATLKLIGGYIYADGGVRGIIIYHESVNSYKAYDRNCTFQPTDPCATVEMHSSGFYIEDTCCSSSFDLSGFPTGGPALFPLKEYSVSLSGDILYVYN